VRVTYKVVAFMVTVKLVEKNVNNKVGTDIVVSLRLQYKIVERICSMNRRKLATRLSQDEPSIRAACCV
jgi:hypothetical protein